MNEPKIEEDPIIPETFLGNDFPIKAFIRKPTKGSKMSK